MTTPLTDRQLAVLAFMRDFFRDNDQLPPSAAIKQHFGWSSDNAASEYVLALAKKGYIERNACGRYRFTRARADAQIQEGVPQA